MDLAKQMNPDNTYHMLTLVIQKDADIPRIRSKVKLLVRAIGASVLQSTGLAVGASETARLLLKRYGGGKIRVSLFPLKVIRMECGLELLVQGKSPCLSGDACPLDQDALLSSPPFPGLMRVFDHVQVRGGIKGRKITIHCRSTELGVAWDDIHGHLSTIRRELFADTEESYMENLRAKHEEVVRLLREKTEKNQLLDQSNNELLQLSNDLEKLARERTIIEMSLRIADQVRNPTTVIGGMARRLLERGELGDREKERISLIAAEAAKIEEIVQQFNTMAAQRKTLFGRENLATLLEDAGQACPTLGRKHIRIEFAPPLEPVEIYANRQLLKIAFVHVLRYLTNLSQEGEVLEITVVDNDEVQVMFSIQLEPAEFEGLGDSMDHPHAAVDIDLDTGLELVRQILSEHQAGFSVENTTDGRLSINMDFPQVFREQAVIPSWAT